MHKIMFVCHGNICRSTLAEFLMKDFVKKAGREDDFLIASSGTSNEEEGSPVHYGTRAILKKRGIDCFNKRAVQLKASDYDKYDLFIGMDRANVKNMTRIFGGDSKGKVKLLLEYTASPRDVIDPYWTGDFTATESDVLEGVLALLDSLK